MLDIHTRWRRIRKQFLTGIVRFIPRDESYEIFDILEKYETGLRAIYGLTLGGDDLESKALNQICADALKD